ncbi:MAG TPA: tRNA (N(6)-L-threonylcarbamoyladenosine(37)-C(2))-methylthiotransferase MtaB [Bryobacteraceae bacterium]|nr:tRNA (N(6)-L-threonylcarbamoyladenosine(37)-C(2))-methylthiotransferase MtaB [Bryobacteraceae bacterium]
MGKYFVQNFGCRAAQADGAALESQLAAKGLELAGERAGADLVVLNTCTVTAAADDDVRQTIRRVHRENPAARILVTGCYAQRAPGELAAMPGVEWVVGNSHKTQIANLVTLEPRSTPYHGNIHVGDIFAQHDFLSAPVEDASGDRTRPNLKIQDGCNNRCSFCIIPFVRGRSRSLPADQVVAQVRGLAARYREVVLSGINLGRWGREPGSNMRLAGLVRRLLAETDVERLRLSSVEPMDFSDDLLGLMAESPRIAKHVHAPLQSGSDTVLRRMHRKYRPRHYADRVRKARAWMPDAAIGADVMVGFPGETEAEFEDSRQFIESLPFTYLHVFTYSERPGTPAADAAQVPVKLRKERNRVLRDLAAAKNLAFRRSMVGQKLSAVTLHETAIALSGNYLKIELAAPREPNRLIDVEIGAVNYDATTVIERGSELTPAHSILSECSPAVVLPGTTALT